MIDFTRPGRMIASSKRDVPKGHICVFNANLCVRSRGKIWYGDLDLTTDETDLVKFAAELGETLYVLRESDARFENEAKPVFERAVASYQADGTVTLTPENRFHAKWNF